MTVYAVFTCDIHKTCSSMRLEAIADDEGIDDIYHQLMDKYNYSFEDIEKYTYKETVELNTLL